MPRINMDDYYVPELKNTREVPPLVYPPELPPKEVAGSLQPSIHETVGLVSPGCFSIGSLMICKTVHEGSDVPSDAICSWSDNGIEYYLQKRVTPKTDKLPEGDSQVGKELSYWRIRGAIWMLSENIFCKVRSWVDGMTTEYETLDWVQENVPSIPTEEVIYHWVDKEWDRSIVISKRVPGETVAAVWTALTAQQKDHIANQLATHCKLLSNWTSDYIETVKGTGVEGRWSLRERKALPFVTRRVEPRVPREDYEKFVKETDTYNEVEISPPNLGEPFVLQHGDLTLENVIVRVPPGSDPAEAMPEITAIIDWEATGYFPKYLQATEPRYNRSFMLETEEDRKNEVQQTDWQWRFSNACVRVGFPLALDYAKAIVRAEHRCYPDLPLETFMQHGNLPSDVPDGYLL